MDENLERTMERTRGGPRIERGAGVKDDARGFHAAPDEDLFARQDR
jgi:hypothetical protein